jgi:hypothetical protein
MSFLPLYHPLLSTLLPHHHPSQLTLTTQLIEPCAFPATLGGAGNCTLADLGTVRPVINDLCNFFNATLYTTYEGCGIELSKEKTTAIIAGRGEEIEF